jgi:hypothetical protein
MLPTVDFCGLKISRLVLGANPFGGFSHQNQERNVQMRSYHTVDRILETWERAEKAGISAMVTNNESDHVVEAVRKYKGGGGSLQWIAQINGRNQQDMERAIADAAEIGCSAVYFHGLLSDDLYRKQDGDSLRKWVERAHAAGVPAGVAGHTPKVHYWINELDLVDFHAVCFFNCGSVHDGRGERFQLTDLPPAVKCVQDIRKPCIGYKIMGAGRIDPRIAFEHAFENIKPGDVVNVGMHRGDKDDMVETNADLVREILEELKG